jgi:hypothetical protein
MLLLPPVALYTIPEVHRTHKAIVVLLQKATAALPRKITWALSSNMEALVIITIIILHKVVKKAYLGVTSTVHSLSSSNRRPQSVRVAWAWALLR